MKIKLFTASILVFLIFIGLVQTGNVQAADSLDDKKKNVEVKINKVEQDILDTAEKVNEMNENIAVLEAAISANNKEVDNATTEVDKYGEEIKTIKKEIEKLRKEIEERNLILKERLSSYQNSGGDLGYLEVIFGSAGFEDFISRYTAVITITKADNDLVEEQKAAVKQVEEKEEEVKEKLTEAEETKNKLAKINQVKKDQKSELVISAASVKAEKKKFEDKKAAYVKEGNDIKALEEKARVQLEAEKAQKVAAEEEKAQATAEEEEEVEEEKVVDNVEQVASKNKEDKTEDKKANNTNNEKTENNPTKKEAPKKVTTEKETPKKETAKKKTPKKKSPKKEKSQSTTKKESTNNSSKPSSDSIKEFSMQATAYTAECTGCSGMTATGINLLADRNKKVVAVDPSVIPLGSRVWVSGYGEAVAGDTGGDIKGNRIDLHFPNKDAAYSFGRRSVTVKILK